MTTQAEKAERFRALHERDGAFVIPNPWDAGSAKLLQALGFEALATTSSGFAETLGRSDGEVTREEKAAHCRALTAITDIPVSADLENCFADDPEEAAATLPLVAAAGVVGGSIEDYGAEGIYDFDHAVERVQAAVEAARAISPPFTLTARAENLIRGRLDLDDTIRRLQAFEAAGADVLYAPGLRTMEDVRAVTGAVTKPVNVLAAGIPDVSVAALAEAGVKRVSIGGALARALTSMAVRAGVEMRDAGTFTWMSEILSRRDMKAALGD